MPKIGDVLYFKSTEEPCVLLEEHPEDYVVHRPVMTAEEGIKYEVGDFPKCVLETEEEQAKRIYARIKMRNELTITDLTESSGPLQIPLPFKKPS